MKRKEPLQPVKVQVGSKDRVIKQSRECFKDVFLSSSKPSTEKPCHVRSPQQPSLASLCSRSFSRAKKPRSLKEQGQQTYPKKVIRVDSSSKSTVISAARPATEQDKTDDGNRELGPRVEIINGQIVLKESSLMVANQDPAIAEGEFEEVEEGIHATSRYSSFMRRQRASRWSLDETRAFYRALQQCGTEFTVMESVLPNRTRKELKMKFFREESQHPELVRRALDASCPLDLDQRGASSS